MLKTKHYCQNQVYVGGYDVIGDVGQLKHVDIENRKERRFFTLEQGPNTSRRVIVSFTVRPEARNEGLISRLCRVKIDFCQGKIMDAQMGRGDHDNLCCISLS